MKKNSGIFVILALLTVFVGCNKNTALPTNTTTERMTVETLESEAESLDGGAESVAQIEQPTIEGSASSSSSPLKETEKQTEKEKTQPKPPATTVTRQTEPHIASAMTTVAPKITQTPTAAASVTHAPAIASPTTAPPTPAPTIQEEFDPDVYVRYAISYGQSIGLTYHAEVHECWDNPIDAGVEVSDEYLKAAIRSRLDRYKNVEGMEYFNVWAEPGKNSKYRILIAYA